MYSTQFPVMSKISTTVLVLITLLYIPLARSKSKPRNPTLRDPPRVHSPGRINGGVAARAHEFPWLVRKVMSGRQFCGGTILNEHYVLTAAHCVYSEALEMITFISAEHNTRCFEGNEHHHTALHVRIYEDYEPVVSKHDVALVRVTPPFNFSRYVRPGRLVRSTFTYPDQVMPVGWGLLSYNGSLPDKLRKVYLEKQPDSDCNNTIPINKYNATISVCYLGARNQSTCNGDSGSPVHCRSGVDGTLVVCAMVSWGFNCARTGRPSVFVRLSYYYDWIQLHIDISNPTPLPYYFNCGGYVHGSGSIIQDMFLFSQQQCHWVIDSFYQVKTFKFLSWNFEPDDEVFFTDMTAKDICAGCTPTKFNPALWDQTYTFSGANPVIIITLRISNSNPNLFRNVELEFTSSGPLVMLYPLSSFQYLAAFKGSLFYPQTLGTIYMNNDAMFVLINPLGTQFKLIQFTWTLMDIDDAGDPQTCPGDYLGFYRIGTRGTYSEYRRQCGRTLPNNIVEDMNGLVILKFQSTSNTKFGYGFGFNYTILRPRP